MSRSLLQRIRDNLPSWRLKHSDDLRLPFVFSLVVHLVLLLVFSISDFLQDDKVLVKPRELNYIKAVVITPPGKEANKAQEATRKVEEDRVKQIRREEQLKKQVEEQQRIAAKQAKLEKEKQEKAAEEKRRLEEQKKKELLAKQNAEKEAREKERLQKQQEEERARQQALMKQRQEREAQLQKMREAMRQQEALREKREALEKQRQAQLAAQDAPILEEYEGHIQAKISQHWSRPLSARNGMQATLQIHLMPGGDVANVQLVESSGDEAFDLSATQAVWKASPLPVPTDAAVFTRNYRVFNLLFAPEDLWE